MPELLIKNVSKSYGSNAALDEISLRIGDGEVCVIVGPSGSGKTTLLNIIAGFIKPDSGELIMNGKTINLLSSRDRNIGMVFQEIGLFSHMTARENISFGLEIKKYNKKDINKRVKEVADMLKISSLLDKRPKNLSGGEAQRVAMGRTLATDPALLLFDEPMGNLDANLKIEMLAEIKRIQLSLKKTFVYVTHDQEQAFSIADRVIIIKEGKLLQEGHPKEIYNNPRNIFVAEFFGIQSMNFFNGVAIPKKKGSFFKGDGLEVTLTKYSPPRDTEVILGIRPTDIKIGNDCKKNSLGTISSIEFLGNNYQVYLNLKDQRKTIIVVVPQEKKYNLKETTKIELDKKRVYLFDKKHGGRLDF